MSREEKRESAMHNQNMPETYAGFSTGELLDMLKKRMSYQSMKGYPREKIIAMGDLAREYFLTPGHLNSPRSQSITNQKAS